MSTELKKKWYQGFALYSTVFFIALYCYTSHIALLIFENDPVNYAKYCYSFCFILGFFLFLFKKNMPIFELIVFYIADIIWVSDFYLNAFFVDYMLSIIGGCFGFAVLTILHKCKLNRLTKLLIVKFFRSTRFIRLRDKLPNYLFGICLFLLLFIYLITEIRLSANKLLMSYLLIYFITGFTLAYINRKIPFTILLIFMIVFYDYWKVIYLLVTAPLPNYKIAFEVFFPLIVVFVYGITGAFIGYGLSKKFSSLTKLKTVFNIRIV